MQIALEASDICAGYGRIPILRGVSFCVRPGEILGVLGHNGMGKTTLMKTLVGTLRCTAGRIRLVGEDVTALPTHLRVRRGIGYVPQGREIFPALSVRENILTGGLATGRSPDELIARATGDFPPLAALLDRKGSALSGGEQQLLALSRALAGDPKVLLLDEPTEGIQPSTVAEIADYLSRVARERNLSVIVVEQDLEFISDLAARVLLFTKGQVTKEIDPKDLKDPGMIDEFFGLHA
jgi:ABC-type branched-subunit amino acid transport system ATPase component